MISDSPTPASKESESHRHIHRISCKGILIAVFIIPFNAYCIALMEFTPAGVIRRSTHSLQMNVVFILLLVILCNSLVRRLHPKAALSRADILGIYIALAIASTFASYDGIVSLMGIPGYCSYYRTPENDWGNTIQPYLPSWLTINDARAVRDFYVGQSSFFSRAYIADWLLPLLGWGAIFLAIMLVMLCINLILRKQWTENERLSYPIAQIPLELSRTEQSMFRNKLFWIGFTVVFGIHLVNGISYLYPAIPSIKLDHDQLFRDGIFRILCADQSGKLRIRVIFSVLGIAFFLPTALSTSCWIFFWLREMQNLLGNIMGWDGIPGFPYFSQQTMGGLVTISAISLVFARKHLSEVFMKIVRIDRQQDSTATAYQLLVLLMILGGTVLFTLCRVAGMSTIAIGLFFLLYFTAAVAVTRLRAELGVPEHLMLYVTPQDSMITFLGTRSLGNQNLVVLGTFLWFTRRERSLPMPHQLEALKIAERGDLSIKQVVAVICIATIIGLIACFVLFPQVLYVEGAGSVGSGAMRTGDEAFRDISAWLNSPNPPDALGIAFFFFGIFMTAGLALMQYLFLWWPLHPAGYALGVSFAVDDYWFSLMLASLIKWTLLKHGGIRMYRKAVSCFLGMIIGEYVAGFGWSLVGLILNTPTYGVWT